MTKHLVVSRFGRQLEWLDRLNGFDRIWVYDKSAEPLQGSIRLPNVGLADHTYLTHIASHYDELPDWIVFCQDDPFDHSANFIAVANAPTFAEAVAESKRQYDTLVVDGYLGIGEKRDIHKGCVLSDPRVRNDPAATAYHEQKYLHLQTFWRHFYQDKHAPRVWPCVYGAQMLVSKDNLRRTPRDGYAWLAEQLAAGNHAHVGAMEQFWYQLVGEAPYELTITVPCKGRLHYLKKTIPSLLAQETASTYRVLVVDYGCPQDTLAWVKSQDHERLHCIRVNDGTEFFSLPRARNIGARCANARIVCFLDGDIIVPRNFVDKAMATMTACTTRRQIGFVHYAFDVTSAHHTRSGNYTFHPYPAELDGDPDDENGRYGVNSVCFVPRSTWEQIRGFDEGMRGWGHDDTDFYKRAIDSGATDVWIGGRLEYLHTSPEERTQFYGEKDVNKSAAANFARMQTERAVNPSGFGVTTDFELFDGVLLGSPDPDRADCRP